MQEKKNPSKLEYMKLEFHFDLEYKGASLAFQGKKKVSGNRVYETRVPFSIRVH